jgi:hypothetical protein
VQLLHLTTAYSIAQFRLPVPGVMPNTSLVQCNRLASLDPFFEAPKARLVNDKNEEVLYYEQSTETDCAGGL